MDNSTGLRCMACGQVYQQRAGLYVCGCRPNIGSDLATLDVEYDYATIAERWSADDLLCGSDRSIARFAPLLPIDGPESLPPLAAGDTPLMSTPRLAARMGMRSLYVKDDGRNPTGSLKDRASAIAVARAGSEGYEIAATASTGNAAAALAGMCASAGMANVIFVPETAPKAKLAQLQVYGSRVLAIRGSYDEAFDLCTEACAKFDWYNRNTGYNPYMSEGKKTVAYEIAAQLRKSVTSASEGGKDPKRFLAPDAVIVSVGDGCIIGGVYKGFYDLYQLGWLERIPRIYGVQSVASAALYNAWHDGRNVPQPVTATTRADSINVNSPRDALKALRAVRESGGAFLAVSDGDILDSIVPLAREGGVFAEPSGAAPLAGLQHALATGLIDSDERIVLINTGSGLKDINAAIEMTGAVTSIEPTLNAVFRAVTAEP